MFRVVLDSTVYVAALLEGEGSNKILRVWRDARIEVLTTPVIVDEVRRVLYLQAAPVGRIAALLKLIENYAITVTPTEHITACRDADDNKFLEAAVAGNATYIVSDE